MNVVIYARYSCDNQREESIEGQIRECKQYADRNDMCIIGEYIDRAFSAKTDNRPEFQKMINDSNSKNFKLLLSGSWIVLPETDMTALDTKPY